MAPAERVQLELGFEGGGLLRCLVARAEAEELVRAFRGAADGHVAVEAERGSVVVDLRRVAYVREVGSPRVMGFGDRA